MTTPRPRLPLALAALALTIAAPPAPGQGADPAPAKSLTDITVAEPLIIDALGITVLLPDKALANVESIPGGKTTAVITPPTAGIRGADWVVQVTNERTENLELTIDAILDEFAKQRTDKARSVGNRIRVFDRMNEADNLIVAGEPAGRFYCELTADKGDTLVTGYTVFSTGPGEFIIVQLDCMGANFDRARVVYETIAASATFEDPYAAAEERSIALRAGAEFLDSLTLDDLKAASLDEPVFLRYYQSAPTGKSSDATEIAFQKIQIRDGQSGELDQTRSRADWAAADREFGFLVQIDARALQGSTTIDTRAVHFLSRDRRNESWSITNTIRQGKNTVSVIQTMIRQGRRLTIKTIREGMPDEQRDWPLPEKGYISAVERYMLPRLIAHKMPEGSPTALDFAFYSYDAKSGKVTMRRDAFSNIGIDGWRYTSQPERTEPEIQTTLDLDGNIVRRLLPNDIIVEPMAPERLSAIWREKGHLMDK